MFADAAIKKKELESLNNSINVETNVCQNISLFEQINNKTSELISNFDSYIQETDLFAEQYHEIAGQINFQKTGMNLESEKKVLELQSEFVLSLKQECDL